MGPHCDSLPPGFELPPLPVMATSSDVSHVLLPIGGLVGREVDLDVFLQTQEDCLAVTMKVVRGCLWFMVPMRGELVT